MIESTVYARVGLAGNPSDGFYGKCLSACVRNWSATVSLRPEDRITIQPNHDMDCLSFSNLAQLTDHSDRYGYYGASRLIHATCSKFHKLTGLDVNKGNGFRIVYDSTIPRQVGLGGSSALVVALLNCLIEFCGVTTWSEADRANVAWAVENEELGIVAGLQDRVIQTYGGLVYMDFNRDLMDKQGYGCYEPLDHLLPLAFIAHTDSPRKDSGQVHNKIRHEFEAGSNRVRGLMFKIADIAKGSRIALERQQFKSLAHLMDCNFRLRLELYGEDIIGGDNLAMRAIALQNGSCAKLPGSGGAVIGLYESDEQYAALAQAYKDNGYQCTKVIWDQ